MKRIKKALSKIVDLLYLPLLLVVVMIREKQDKKKDE